MQIGAQRTSALHVTYKTEFLYGENRGNSLKFPRIMTDTAADLVLGHGYHIPRAMELYKGKSLLIH
jgi:poly-gamma-glutamate capsule biosynthesis protein CapA/YwtB (metallophosphatase superfamily)